MQTETLYANDDEYEDSKAANIPASVASYFTPPTTASNELALSNPQNTRTSPLEFPSHPAPSTLILTTSLLFAQWQYTYLIPLLVVAYMLMLGLVAGCGVGRALWDVLVGVGDAVRDDVDEEFEVSEEGRERGVRGVRLVTAPAILVYLTARGLTLGTLGTLHYLYSLFHSGHATAILRHITNTSYIITTGMWTVWVSLPARVVRVVGKEVGMTVWGMTRSGVRVATGVVGEVAGVAGMSAWIGTWVFGRGLRLVTLTRPVAMYTARTAYGMMVRPLMLRVGNAAFGGLQAGFQVAHVWSAVLLRTWTVSGTITVALANRLTPIATACLWALITQATRLWARLSFPAFEVDEDAVERVGRVLGAVLRAGPGAYEAVVEPMVERAVRAASSLASSVEVSPSTLEHEQEGESEMPQTPSVMTHTPASTTFTPITTTTITAFTFPTSPSLTVPTLTALNDSLLTAEYTLSLILLGIFSFIQHTQHLALQSLSSTPSATLQTISLPTPHPIRLLTQSSHSVSRITRRWVGVWTVLAAVRGRVREVREGVGRAGGSSGSVLVGGR
ncbi:uncharacterized protein EV422DRAFT_286638 [Fimicolochytrium jonesii]|uniref:uncharacterized protein n=1 Tax=Fimicolochytrium jonesii TaxID=1396493 RepID=UPI0022FF2FF4|nr:uncharacterized protein EV422DRAFT_286638 [Fimicolochytrium jonesii]KAI8816507.1 hypothetical protein EV422DRAFT_286638 [Fimicolochytrium jonesii]